MELKLDLSQQALVVRQKSNLRKHVSLSLVIYAKMQIMMNGFRLVFAVSTS